MMFDTFADERNAHGPFKLFETARWFGQGGMPEPAGMIAAGVQMESSLAEHAVFFFDQMRRTKKPNVAYPDREDIYSIGGHLDFTVLTAEGHTSRRLHVWDEDVVGEKIDPLREVNPDPSSVEGVGRILAAA